MLAPSGMTSRIWKLTSSYPQVYLPLACIMIQVRPFFPLLAPIGQIFYNIFVSP